VTDFIELAEWRTPLISPAIVREPSRARLCRIIIVFRPLMGDCSEFSASVVARKLLFCSKFQVLNLCSHFKPTKFA
jgi:hypothetical protein